jgi:hypothetical protein
MSCAKSKFGAGNNPEYAEYIYYINNIRFLKSSSLNNCRRNTNVLPSFTPVLSGLSVTTSKTNTYSLVYVYGSNFLPNGTTFIQFGTYGYLPVTYYSSFNLSFVVPLNAVAGNYAVKVVNLYNGNFSPPVNQSYPGNLNFSNSINYTIT